MRILTTRPLHSKKAGATCPVDGDNARTACPVDGDNTRTTRHTHSTKRIIFCGVTAILLCMLVISLLGVMTSQKSTATESENNLPVDTTEESSSFGVEFHGDMFYTPEEIEVLYKEQYGYEVTCYWSEYLNAQNEKAHFLCICDPYNGKLFALEGALTDAGWLFGGNTWNWFIANSDLSEECAYARNAEFWRIEDLEEAFFERLGLVAKITISNISKPSVVALVSFDKNSCYVYDYIIEHPEIGMVTTEKSFESFCKAVGFVEDEDTFN